MNNALLVFFGCGIGGLLRYYTSRLICAVIDSPFPYSTLFINVSGSFAMGLLFTWLLRHNSNLAQSLGPFLLVGLLGGYTTFSAFSVETLGLVHSGKLLQAIFYALVSVLLCVGGASLGMTMAKA
ncbi:MAG: fluoride efflux transporter CrcB [Gammaproteobacteria bacterium]